MYWKLNSDRLISFNKMLININYIYSLRSIIDFSIKLIMAFVLTLSVVSALVGFVFVLSIIAVLSIIFRME